jgi:hypothetical protein
VTHLEVVTLVDGIEVAVDTIEPSARRTSDLGLKFAVHDVVGGYLIEQAEVSLRWACRSWRTIAR